MVGFTADGSRTSEQVIADDADLQAGIGDLAGLVAGSLGLPELLAEVAAFAVHAIPGADGAGVTLLHLDRTDNVVAALAASAPFVAAIDEIQYVALKEGPCITAALECRTVRSGSLGGRRGGRGSVPAWAGGGCTVRCRCRCCCLIRWSGQSTYMPTAETSSMGTPLNSGNCSPNQLLSPCTMRRSSRVRLLALSSCSRRCRRAR